MSYPLPTREDLLNALRRTPTKRWTRRVFVVAVVAAGVGLVWLQKHDLMINDTGWIIDNPRWYSIKCKDGTSGTFIGTKIEIEGCEITPTHELRPFGR